MKRLTWAVLAVAACTPAVNIGSDLEENGQICDLVSPPPVVCPAMPWGAPVTFGSAGDLQAKLIGRWGFCGGERKYSGRGPLSGLAFGAGVEFWTESGALRYAWLTGAADHLTRAEDSGSSGDVQLSLEQGRGVAVLAAADGVSAQWKVDFFAGQPVLQNSAFDVWNFVPLP